MEPAKFSVLNPLATCFVPSDIKKDKNITKKLHSNIKDYNKVQKHSNSITKFEIGTYPEKAKILRKLLLSCPTRSVLDSKHSAFKLLDENIYFTKGSGDLPYGEASSNIYCSITSRTIFNFTLIALLKCALTYPEKKCAITYDSNAAINHIETLDLEEKSKFEEKCNCPPMFGCIIPWNFFGNPFNLNSSCNKKHVHVRHYSNAVENRVSSCSSPKCSTLKSDSIKCIKNTKLEQYSRELKEIVKDVCEMVTFTSDDDIDADFLCDFDNLNPREIPNAVDGHNNQIKVTCRESCKTEKSIDAEIVSGESDYCNLENLMMEMEIPKDTPKIMDDDFHSLLDEGISMESDDGGIFPVYEKMTETCVYPRYEPRLSFDPEELPEKTICNPPCSIWCDSLPQPAKDTYRKFIKSLPKQQGLCNFPNGKNSSIAYSTVKMPLYNGYFSENDALKRNKENISPFQFQSNFDAESKDKTLLHRYPTSYVKIGQPSHNVKGGKRQSLPLSKDLSYNLVNERGTNFHKKKHASMWGPFDGADSLWQPLPDSMVSVEQNPSKQSAHRKVRELKRQVSLN